MFMPYIEPAFLARLRGNSMRAWAARLSLCLMGLLTLFPAHAAERRVALVIGNNLYLHADALKTAVADAQAIKKQLELRDFQVVYRENATRRDMNNAVDEFMAKLSSDTVAVVFYAGHGVQVNSANYLIPTDLVAEKVGDFANDGIDLGHLIDRMSQQQTRFALAVIDACRDNPFGGKDRGLATSRGLTAPLGNASGVMVVYSAGANQKALDRLGNNDHSANGLFTREFLKAMQIPGLKVQDVVLAAKAEIIAQAKSIGYTQTPAIYDESQGTFLFTPPNNLPDNQANNNTPNNAPTKPENANVPPPQGGLTLEDIEKQQENRKKWSDWQARMQMDYEKVAKLESDADLKVAAWERFLAAYPQKNPYSDKDDGLRNEARRRKQSAEAESQRAPQVAVTQQTTPSAPSGIIKDCSNCPEMVVIPSGSFMMGSSASEAGREGNEGPQHQVSVRSYALGKTLVTQGQWRYLMGSNPSKFTNCGDDCPVEQVSWDDAQEYVRKLSAQSGKTYRLPSEAEWEYACRAGQQQLYCGSNAVDSMAWYNGNSGLTTHPVGQKQANAWGLYDMSGNVWEWTQDCWNNSYSGAPSDGSAWLSGSCEYRVLRGGSWIYAPRWVRSAYRSEGVPGFRGDDSGFRVARTLN